MVTRGSPKPLFWVRILVPLPNSRFRKKPAVFFLFVRQRDEIKIAPPAGREARLYALQAAVIRRWFGLLNQTMKCVVRFFQQSICARPEICNENLVEFCAVFIGTLDRKRDARFVSTIPENVTGLSKIVKYQAEGKDTGAFGKGAGLWMNGQRTEAGRKRQDTRRKRGV